MAATFGIRVKKIHTDNGIFAEEGFKSDVSDNNQTISYCRVGAHFQNGISEASIKQPTEKARTLLNHVKHLWPEVIQPCLWTFTLKQAKFNLINLRLGKSGKSRTKFFSAMHNKINIRHYHTFGRSLYVLDARLQGASFIQKWDKQVRVDAYVGRSTIHAGNVSLILNLSTGHVSLQFQVVFNEKFSTVPSLKNRSVPASWKFIRENNRELATYKYFNLEDLWSKSERESDVKFNIQKDASKKYFQQPKDDALDFFDIEHVTDNLVSTILQKSKSYLEAAKGNLSDTNNNQTFPIRPTLEQGVAVNEVVPTAESPTALEAATTA